jgi:hypothetical protein
MVTAPTVLSASWLARGRLTPDESEIFGEAIGRREGYFGVHAAAAPKLYGGISKTSIVSPPTTHP